MSSSRTPSGSTLVGGLATSGADVAGTSGADVAGTSGTGDSAAAVVAFGACVDDATPPFFGVPPEHAAATIAIIARPAIGLAPVH